MRNEGWQVDGLAKAKLSSKRKDVDKMNLELSVAHRARADNSKGVQMKSNETNNLHYAAHYRFAANESS